MIDPRWWSILGKAPETICFWVRYTYRAFVRWTSWQVWWRRQQRTPCRTPETCVFYSNEWFSTITYIAFIRLQYCIVAALNENRQLTSDTYTLPPDNKLLKLMYSPVSSSSLDRVYDVSYYYATYHTFPDDGASWCNGRGIQYYCQPWDCCLLMVDNVIPSSVSSILWSGECNLDARHWSDRC